MIYDCLVIGAGPAGMAAAIYLARAKVKFAVIEGNAPGGKVVTTSNVDNYPGFTSIGGADLALAIFEQVNNLNVEYISELVHHIEFSDEVFKVSTDSTAYLAKRILVASGTSNKVLGVKNEAKLIGRGISYCAVCDGMLYQDQDVVVVGGGNSAFEESLYLARICKTVYIVHRTDQYRASASLQEKVKSTPNIILHPFTQIKEFVEEDNKLAKILIDTIGKESSLSVKGAFIYIGYQPTTSFIKDLDVLDETGYLVVDSKYESRIKGLYGAGDCINHGIKQIATAIGDGASAASYIIKSLLR